MPKYKGFISLRILILLIVLLLLLTTILLANFRNKKIIHTVENKKLAEDTSKMLVPENIYPLNLPYNPDDVPVPTYSFPITRKNFDWKVPDLPKGFEWKEVLEPTPDEQFIIDNTIYFDQAYTERIDYTEKYSPYIKTTGKLFSVTVTDKDPLYKDSGFALSEELRKTLEDSDWDNELRFGVFRVMPFCASGPQGSIEGWIKQNGNLARVYTYSYYQQGNMDFTNGPLKFIPPTSTEMSIYISDPVDLRNVLPKQ